MIFRVLSSFGNGNVEALNTINEISKLIVTDDEIVFDFTSFTENNPFNNLLIASAIKQFYKLNKDKTKVSILPKSNNDFLSHIGFYNMIGANFGKMLGEAKPSSNYVPITRIKFDINFYDVVEKNAKDLALLLRFDKDLKEFLTYAFTETIRNVYEHAETNQVYVCAQKWSSMDLVEISIVDTGCGIAHALGKRFIDKDEEQLIHLAVLPGISARSNHSYLNKDDAWRNSGYGLYALRKLSNLYRGSFFLCSGNKAIYQFQDQVENYDTNFKGTAIAIRIRTDVNINFKETLRRVIREGEIDAKKIQNSITKASKSSGGNYNGQA